MFTGLLALPIWGIAVVALVLSHITIVCVTVFLHRQQAHRALTLHPVVSHFFRFWLWLTTGMSTKAWVAIHRKHHAYSDLAADPHSPQVHGIRKVLLEGAELYRVESRNAQTLEKYGHSTPDDWLERNLYTRHGKLGLGIMLITDLVLFGAIGLTVWAVQMIWIPFFAAGVINGVGHFRGYRNFATSDASRNILPWGILIGGEELHNNHHAYISSARFSNRWWEFDIGWMYIRILEMLHLAKVRKVAPRLRLTFPKKRCDEGTLAAIIAHRYDVLMKYSSALSALTRSELDRLRIEGAGALSEIALLDPDSGRVPKETLLSSTPQRPRIEKLIVSSALIGTVHWMRQDLIGLWSRSSASSVQLAQNLEDWCARAEASGIDALRHFAAKLRAYG